MIDSLKNGVNFQVLLERARLGFLTTYSSSWIHLLSLLISSKIQIIKLSDISENLNLLIDSFEFADEFKWIHWWILMNLLMNSNQFVDEFIEEFKWTHWWICWWILVNSLRNPSEFIEELEWIHGRILVNSLRKSSGSLRILVNSLRNLSEFIEES